MKWYSKSFRRHLLDMHIADWNPEFLSQFDVETYIANLKTAQISTAMVYLQSHIGLCYFPSKIAPMHKAMIGREHTMRTLINRCREEGIHTIAYYSLVFNTWAEQKYPEWGMLNEEGISPLKLGSRYGHCCPNNMEYREFTKEQIHEMLNYCNPDGVFFDMPFWPTPCTCKQCRTRFEKEEGMPFPKNPNDPRLLAARRRWMSEFTAFTTAEVKKLRPEMVIEYNCAFAALSEDDPCISEEVCRSGDYAGGDLYNTFRTQAFACKLYEALTLNPPFEFMFGRCMPSLAAHTITKSKDRLMLSAMLTVAHNGACFVIDAIDPVGTMDARVYEQIGEIFNEVKKYEPSMNGPLRKEALIYLDQGFKGFPQGRPYTHYSGAIGAYETLSRAHICAGIGCKLNLTALAQAKALIVSLPQELDSTVRKQMIEYVANGGTLYFSGAFEKELLKELLGATYVKNTPDEYNYIAPTTLGADILPEYNAKYPFPIPDYLPIVEGVPSEYVVATITEPYQPKEAGQFASIHSNPPGTPTEYPGLVVRPYGKGTVIWCAGPIESMNTEAYRSLMLRLLENALPAAELSLETTAPKRVELVVTDSDDQKYTRISAVTLNEEDEAETIPPFKVALRADRAVESVVLLPEGSKVNYLVKDGRVRFETRPLFIHDRYEIRWAD